MARSRMAREGRVGLLVTARASLCRGELAVSVLAPELSSPGPLLLLGLASVRLGLASMRRTWEATHLSHPRQSWSELQSLSGSSI